MKTKSITWVVKLDNLSKTNPKKDKKLVKSKTKEGAIRTAKANSVVFRSGSAYAEAYPADPVIDLGMTKTSEAALRKFNLGF